jgi:Cu2+-containing amine oxidase
MTELTLSTTSLHPLEPLSPEEITAASTILVREKSLTASARFVYIELREPSKQVVEAFEPGSSWEREAFIVLRDRALQATFEAVVSLSTGTVISYTEVPDAQPPITLEEFLRCEEVIKADPRWQEAMRKRGVSDFSLAVQVFGALADIKWGLWGCVNHKLNSAWDYDYHKYGVWKLMRARLKVADPRWAFWLSSV